MSRKTVHTFMKKAMGITLCGVLAGGVAVGITDGIHFPGYAVYAETGEAVHLSKGANGENVRNGMDVSDIVEETMPCVVAITTKSVQDMQDYYGRLFQFGGYAPSTREVKGSGSGIIIGKSSNELLMVTNYHVIDDADTVSVAFADGSTCEAKVKGSEPDMDLAVVVVSLEDVDDETLDEIKVASIGNSDDLKVGEQVVAIGNAMGYGQSVTTGIVSAKNRSLDDFDEEGVNLIQTDAAINPGNSGGALLNMNGEVVGINSAKLAATQIEGMNYAIAISDVADVIEDLMNEVSREQVEGKHGVLGIRGTTVSEETSTMYGIPKGVFVSEVFEDSAAEAAGITTNSIITKLDGKRMSTIDELKDRLAYYEPGEEAEVTLQVMTEDGYTEKVVTVTLDASEEEQ